MSRSTLDIYDSVRETLNVPNSGDSEPDTTTYTEDRVLRLINQAIRIIASKGEVATDEQAIVIGPGTRFYSLPSGTSRVRFAFIDGYPEGLRLADPDRLVELGEGDATGTPTHYWEQGEQIGLYPTPATTQTLYVYRSGTPSALTSIDASQTINLPDFYCDAIQEFVLHGLTRKDDPPFASAALQNWADLLKNAERVDRERQARHYAGPILKKHSRTIPGFAKGSN